MPGLAIGLALVGVLAGPIDVSLLTLRQRRTEPDRLGRVMAISISINTSGLPIGAALGGMLVAGSPHAALPVAAVASLLAAFATYSLVPADDADA
jgi:predicted MFS family arabinose efflux permease